MNREAIKRRIANDADLPCEAGGFGDIRGIVEWKQLPRGTYRYSHDGMTADVWQVAGKGWLWSVYDNASLPKFGATSGLLAAHEGVYQPTLDAACELALKAMAV